MRMELEIPGDILETTKKKLALEKLAKNITAANLSFLAELSDKSGINDKLEKNKGKIKLVL